MDIKEDKKPQLPKKPVMFHYVIVLLVLLAVNLFLVPALSERSIQEASYDEFLDGYRKLQESGIRTCLHLIDGLPGETKDMMLESVQTVSLLKPWSVKLHLLHVIKGTVCEKMFTSGEFDVMEKDEYVNLVCDELERIDKSVVIQRLTGDGARDTLVAPLWSLKKFEVLNAIDKELEIRDSFQGKYV